jgi:hypothetical protein
MAGDIFAGPKTALKHRRSITGWSIFAALTKLPSPACLTHHKHRCRVSARDRIATQQR